ncbi:MAG: cobalt-precorrin-5B (C(1))-methyltransferase [Bacteroidales bacterium]|nr:cobalt-precorrin-5B (C(1))-methyltransferase [Bacteroidales bacterium]
MILILGGTTEGRLAVRVADAAGSSYWYSTRDALQQIECLHGTHMTGALGATSMADFCATHDIRLLIDAGHPFAAELHRTVAVVAEELDLPVIRVERVYPPREKDTIWCRDISDALARLEADGITSLLALTGVQTIRALKPYWSRNDCRMRILDRDESRALASAEGFPADKLVYYAADDTASLLASVRPQAILTKESGESGGFTEKVDAARAAGVRVYALERPAMPAGFVTVTGEHGLRREIERLLPGFFPLRTGFTTGACATAASKAALLALLGREVGETVSITLPDGETLALPVSGVTRHAAEPFTAVGTATVVKDAGDDPDVTNGSAIVAKVTFSKEPGIHFLQGEGVGRVTLPGLGLPVGGPAINRVPREMMTRELSALYAGGLDVTISVPGGRELALKTFNPKLGVVDGISIIGTSGIVRPFSDQAFVDALRKEIEVALAIGVDHLVINSGAKSEAFLRSRFPDFPPQAFIHYGNLVGETLKLAAELGVRRVTMGVMLGKAVKLAEGHLDTHSRSVVMNREFLKGVAAEAGCSSAVTEAIDRLTLARELWTALSPDDARRFLSAILSRCRAACATVYPATAGTLEIILLDESGFSLSL